MAGLVDSNWDSSKFRNDNSATLPPLKFDASIEATSIPLKTEELVKAYQLVSKLSHYDKKEDKKLQNGKTYVIKELSKEISKSLGLGSGFLYNSNPFDKQFIALMEKALTEYIDALKKWKADKEKALRDNQQERDNRDAKLKSDCTKVLTANGLSAFALNQFSSAILYEQVKNLLIEQYKAENADYSPDKQYDDDGRFWEYPEVSYDSVSGEFSVYLSKEYY
jgi:hypothetical protein